MTVLLHWWWLRLDVDKGSSGALITLKKRKFMFLSQEARPVLEYFDEKKKKNIRGGNVILTFLFLYSALHGILVQFPVGHHIPLSIAQRHCSSPGRGRADWEGLDSGPGGQRRAGVPTEQSCMKPSWSQLGNLLHCEALCQKLWEGGGKEPHLPLISFQLVGKICADDYRAKSCNRGRTDRWEVSG